MKLNFKSTLEPKEMVGIGMSHVLVVEDAVAEQLLEAMKVEGSKRMHVRINESVSNRALQHSADGYYYIGVGNQWRKEAKLVVGVTYELQIDTNGADEIVVPRELQEVLDQMPEAKEAWEQCTPGKKRSWLIYVNGVKNSDSKIKRSLTIVDRLLGL